MRKKQILSPLFPILDNKGAYASGGQVYVYAQGTSTALPTYKDSKLQTLNDSPVILDATGRANVWVDAPCDIDVLDMAGNYLASQSNVNAREEGESYSTIIQADQALTSGDPSASIDSIELYNELSSEAAYNFHASLFFNFSGSSSGDAQVGLVDGGAGSGSLVVSATSKLYDVGASPAFVSAQQTSGAAGFAHTYSISDYAATYWLEINGVVSFSDENEQTLLNPAFVFANSPNGTMSLKRNSWFAMHRVEV